MTNMKIPAVLTDWRLLVAFTIISWGTYNVVLKRISGKIPWQLSMLFFVAGYSLVAVVYVSLNFSELRHGFFRPVNSMALAAGVLCGFGAVTFFKAIPTAPGSILMPLVGLYVLVAAIGCLFVMKEPVSPRILLGIFFAVISIMLLGK